MGSKRPNTRVGTPVTLPTPVAESLGLDAVFYLGAGVAALGALIVFARPLPRL